MSESVLLSAGSLCVEFWPEGDRYRHQIAFAVPDTPGPWLTSVEGAADDTWPFSPPLQELHVERRAGDKQVALLVGRAGRAHWSLSVEVDRSRETLFFDAACRCASSAAHLRSSYRALDGALPDGSERVALSGYELRLLEGELQFDDCGAGFSIGPRRGACETDAVQTFRWRYQIGPS
jgi:hypothetical protein